MLMANDTAAAHQGNSPALAWGTAILAIILVKTEQMAKIQVRWKYILANS